MIIIDKLHRGRFGNKLLHYNNMVQIAIFLGTEYNSVPYNGYEFTGIKNNYYSNIKLNDFHLKDIYNLDKNINYRLRECLGELFFEFQYNTRHIFNIDIVNIGKDFTNIGIHFRGTDFHQWNPDSILNLEYYINSVEYCLNEYDNVKFHLFTDDKNMVSFTSTEKHLKEKNIPYRYGSSTYKNSHFINDYYELCSTDVIISSPSTFAICAGIMGKEKYIIHSEKWIKSRTDKNDKFWVDLSSRENKNYKLKKIL